MFDKSLQKQFLKSLKYFSYLPFKQRQGQSDVIIKPNFCFKVRPMLYLNLKEKEK